MLGTVLIVDDAKVVRSALGRILKRCGYASIEAENGQVALDRCAENPDICVVFLDLNMPVMGGMEFLEKFSAQFADSQRPPVIVVSTETEMSSILKAISLGAHEYVMKPFDEDIIKSKMDMAGIAYES
ncbi:MAG: PleD family two-component system response regulator [Mariprofundus sp.]